MRGHAEFCLPYERESLRRVDAPFLSLRSAGFPQLDREATVSFGNEDRFAPRAVNLQRESFSFFNGRIRAKYKSLVL